MSTLSIHDIQGLSAFSNQVRIPSGHRLTFDGALNLRNLSTTNLPTSGNLEGDIVYNTNTKGIRSKGEKRIVLSILSFLWKNLLFFSKEIPLIIYC